MFYSQSVLGKTTADLLRARSTGAVLTIGKDTFTRGALAGVACFNYLAAQNLTRCLADLPVTSTREVFDTVAPASLALPRLGAITLAVLGAAFEAKGLGGDAPLEAWVRKHQAKDQKDLVSFGTLKKAAHRDQVAAAKERQALKRRKRQRRDQAHAIRTDRYITRTATAQAADR